MANMMANVVSGDDDCTESSTACTHPFKSETRPVLRDASPAIETHQSQREEKRTPQVPVPQRLAQQTPQVKSVTVRASAVLWLPRPQSHLHARAA